MLLYYWGAPKMNSGKNNRNQVIYYKRGKNSGKFRIRYLCKER